MDLSGLYLEVMLLKIVVLLTDHSDPLLLFAND